MTDHTAERPSERFLTTGVATRADARAIETLEQHRSHLAEELAGPDYAGASYDRRAVTALSWALALVSTIREEGGVDD